MGKSLVIVESPTKARTIRKFLPDDFVVRSSMGHIRDLPQSADEVPAKVREKSWSQLGVDVEHDFDPVYVVPKQKRKVVKELREALADADELVLATDEDREGESISWHLLEVLKPKIPVKRMVFHEITREAIERALGDFRDVDEKLVRAQETRRILDRLVGYTVSPLLWKKIGGKLSAGRVQSVAVRMLVDRERKRRAFRQATYWDLKASLAREGADFQATLVALDGRRLATGRDFDESTGKLPEGSDLVLLGEKEAEELAGRLRGAEWAVRSVEEKPQSRRPSPPFTTSTLQQDANRKLGMSAKQAMRIAQDLYQRGFITYMRTDSVHLSNQAIEAARHWVEKEYGKNYLSPKPRRFQTKSKGAQEAHEAIRPAGDRFKSPQETGLTGPEGALYELIWERTVACQMADARQTNVSVSITADDVEFRASGKRIDFPGFLRAYVEGTDDPAEAIRHREVSLPPLTEGDRPELRELEAVGHETKPPARYTEAALVQALEREGIGRPSTYASIISTIIDRGYATVEKRALVPSYRAFAVTQLLERNFPDLVDPGFTAGMEQTLDEIAVGREEWLPYLRKFYAGEDGLERQVASQEQQIQPSEARAIRLEALDAQVRLGRFGPYLESEVDGETIRVSVPEEIAPGDLDQETVARLLEQKARGPEPLGEDPETGEPVFVLTGRYGPYVQLGHQTDGHKPKRTSLPKEMVPEDVDLEVALELLRLPRPLGPHPDGGEVQAGIGRYGPYVVRLKPDGKRDYRSLKAGDDVLTVGLDRALELLAQPKGSRGGQKVLRELGEHPDDGKPIQLLDGRYGPYVKHGRTNASLPKGESPDEVDLARAVELIRKKAGRKGKGKTKKAKGG